MTHRTKSRVSRKSERQDARPFAHRTGRWAKKCRGKFIYLGKVEDDPSGQHAWLKWLEIRDDVRAGRTPRPQTEGLTVEDLVERWLTSKQLKCESGELTNNSYARYQRLAGIVLRCFERRRAEDLDYQDFQRLRAVLAKRYGVQQLRQSIVHARGIFRWGLVNGLLTSPAKFGTEFALPSAAALRKARNAHGPRMFEPEQVRAILDEASPTVKAMVLLALNGGLGAKDVSEVPIHAVDLEKGWLEFARGKTGINRRIPLWPETVAAIHASLATRKKAKPGCAKLLFLTERGRSWLTTNESSMVTQAFQRAAKKAGVVGRQFYDLRRTFQTIGEESGDVVGVLAIMGHAASSADMGAIYRQRVTDQRLQAVVGTVRNWLFQEAEPVVVKFPSVG